MTYGKSKHLNQLQTYFSISGAQCTKSWLQNLKAGFLMSSIKVIRSPQGWGLFTISLSSRTLHKKTKQPESDQNKLDEPQAVWSHSQRTPQIYFVCLWAGGPEAPPGDLFLDGLGVGLSKQVEHGAAEVMGVAVGVAELIGYRVEEQVTPCRKHVEQGGVTICNPGHTTVSSIPLTLQ